MKRKGGKNYTRIEGNLLVGADDYKLIYVNNGSIYDQDREETIGPSIELGDTGLTLTTNGTHIRIKDEDEILVAIPIGLNGIIADGVDISSKDEDYLTEYGITIKTPDDSVDDNDFKIVIPEEELTASITVVSK